jgi:uncharacterized protein
MEASQMTDQTPISPDITSDDKLWVLLAYVVPVLVPIIILLMEDKKNRPFIKAHNVQALILGAISFVLGAISMGCLGVIVWFVMIYWGIQGYQGKYVTIPLVTDFCKQQGWA